METSHGSGFQGARAGAHASSTGAGHVQTIRRNQSRSFGKTGQARGASSLRWAFPPHTSHPKRQRGRPPEIVLYRVCVSGSATGGRVLVEHRKTYSLADASGDWTQPRLGLRPRPAMSQTCPALYGAGLPRSETQGNCMESTNKQTPSPFFVPPGTAENSPPFQRWALPSGEAPAPSGATELAARRLVR